MKRTTQFPAIFVGVLLLGQMVHASESVSRAEYEALLARVSKLESILSSLQIELDGELEATSASQLIASKKPKTSLLDNVINIIQVREDATTYPWMDTALWESLAKGMSPKEITSILGRPTLNEPSLSKRIDVVYTYKGKQSSTGNRIKGVVRFYRNQLVEIEPPEIQ